MGEPLCLLALAMTFVPSSATVMAPTLSTPQRALNSMTRAKLRASSSRCARRNAQIVSWSGCVSAQSRRTGTQSCVLHSIWRLEKTPVA